MSIYRYLIVLWSIAASAFAQKEALAEATGESTLDYTLPLPEWTIKLIVVDEDMDLEGFNAFFTSALSSHLEVFMDSNIPSNGNLGTGKLENIEINSDIKRTFLGTDGEDQLPVSMLQSNLKGTATILFDNVDDRLITQVRKSLATADLRIALELSLVGTFFRRFLQRLAANSILSITVKVQIAIDGAIIEEGTVAEALEVDEDSGLSLMAIAAILIFILMLFTLVGLYFLIRRQRQQAAKRRQRNWKRTPEERRAARRKAQMQREESLKKENPDQWMDEMAEKMTSIPVRNVTQKPRKKVLQPTTRPAMQVKKSSASDLLFSIHESCEESTHGGDGEAAEEEEESMGEFDGEMGMTDFGLESMQFSDVDLASPEDYIPRIVNDSTVYL